MSRSKPFMYIIAGCIGCYGGSWQIIRRKHKIEHLDRMKAVLSSDAKECPSSMTKSEFENSYKMRRVCVEGIPDFDNEVYVGPLKPPISAKLPYSRYEFCGYVHTPLKMKDGTHVLLNRGWIYESDIHSCSQSEYEPNNDEIESNMRFEGVLKEVQTDTDIPFNVNKDIWPYVCKQALNTKWNMSIDDEHIPIVLHVLEPKLDCDSWPKRIQESDLLSVTVSPEQHLSYVIFWYAMCIISWYYAFVFFKYPSAKQLFKRRLLKNRPVLKKSDVLRLKERHFK